MAVRDGEHFDFIVVGGGTAGNCVAGRLAENPKVRILVIEAGVGNPQDHPEITTPANAMNLRNSAHDWSYKSTLVKREDYERVEKPNTRGKALGGSSSLNYFTWVPGCKPTFDRWAEYGGKEWTWDPLVHYLRKSATYHDDPKLYLPQLRKIGGGGPIHISHAELIEEMAPFRDNLQKAWGVRSASWVFLKDKPNITILAETHAKKLLINYADRICRGVRAMTPDGKDLNVFADREVILSEGVFESPKLLMLSGIGPTRELAKFDVDVVVDSRHVGQNLVDHPAVPFVLRVKEGIGMDSAVLRKGAENEKLQAKYNKDHSGPMGSGFLEMVAFPRVDDYLEKDEAYRKAKEANGGLDPFSPEGQPHFELDFVCLWGSAFQWHFPFPREGEHTTVVVDLVRPISDPGEVTLRSADALEQPNINLNFFANDLDIIAMREGIRFSYDVLTKGEGFKDLVIAESPWEMPLGSDEEVKRAVLDRCQTAFHPVGTARLSKSIDQGVVDPSLKVHGVRNLRVIDASVMPVIPDCRIQNSVYMVAEKGADMIKAEHRDIY
ncbi:hypothetical protein MKX07_007720 [Trichoderma sp. CBMAI-0711]|uniref:Aryl-alcohol oxidase n=1 Tax=Trichoderma parareesei TaxID=858221 RepID=A0A2H2Z4F1_TRIPA|nr:hypothetical protein MKX07_007720 [Trichoderma sp. CBMAI-0711]OTA00412.1 aryl-alcohol oxidase [Trichoderma parareesei]